MKLIGIYKITSPTNKIYIGQSNDVYKRWNSYFKLNCVDQPKLYRSLTKYGIKNHKFEFIEECTIEQLDDREIYWGTYYNSLNEGLNCRLGNSRGICSEETKTKIGNKQRGISKNKGRISPNKGNSYIMSEATKNKMKKPKSYSNKRFKPILQYDLENNFIKKWDSAKEAAKHIGTDPGTLCQCLKGKIPTVKKYIWKYQKQNINSCYE